MEQVYGGYQRSPLMTQGNKATQGADRQHSDAGKIDYYAYGGKVGGDFNDRRAAHQLEYNIKEKGNKDAKKRFEATRYGKDWANRDTWKRVADHLGIDKVDSTTDLRQMYDFVQGIGVKADDDDKPEYTPTPLPEDPYAGGGDDRLIGRPFPGRPGSGGGKGNVPGSIQYNPPSDNSELGRAISSVADYGNRGTDDYFGRFLPEMGQRNVNEAKATGRSLLSNIQKFTGKVPELGDPKDLFNFYLGKLKD